MIELFSVLVLVGIGIVAGFLNVVAGGGSLLTIPILIFMGLPPNTANATNRIAIFWQNIFAIRKFDNAGLVEARYSIYLGLASVPGAVIGALMAVAIDGVVFVKLLALLMLAVGVAILFGSSRRADYAEGIGHSQSWKGVLVLFLVGIYGGFVHAGVGFIIILVLTWLTTFSLAKINSIKVIVAFIYTIPVIGIFILEDAIDWTHGLVLAVGTSLGGWLGSVFSIAKGDKWIKIFVFSALVTMSIKLWFYN